MRSGEYGSWVGMGYEACVDSRQSHLFNETLVICVKECSSISVLEVIWISGLISLLLGIMHMCPKL
jgi:hypothetical protein